MFRKELEGLINKHSMENGSNTPDFLLAEFLNSCLAAFDLAVQQRDKWYSVRLAPGSVVHECPECKERSKITNKDW